MINPGIEIIIEKQRKMVVIEFPDTTAYQASFRSGRKVRIYSGD
jgi:hypothetical protein